MNTFLESLIQAAILAPSGDNTQPWVFHMDPQNKKIDVLIDPLRDTSPMNASQRMARIAVGAAVENILRTCSDNKQEATFIFSKSPSKATIFLQSSQLPNQTARIPSEIVERVSNRKFFDGTMISQDKIDELQKSIGALDRVHTVWINDREKLKPWAQLIGKADSLMFGIRQNRLAFLQNVRFDRPPKDTVGEGLSLGALELSVIERLGLHVMGRLSDQAYALGGIGKALRRKAMNWIERSSGICILVSPHSDEITDYEVGRLMQRTWLELTKAGCAVQPMMSIPVLDNILRHSKNPSVLGRSQTKIDELCSKQLPMQIQGRVAAILRFGLSSPPTARTGRRPINTVTQWES